MSLRDRLVEVEGSARAESSAIRALKAELLQVSKERDEAQAIASLFEQARRGKIDVPYWQIKSASAKGHRAIVMAQMTDWHLDEVVRPEEIEYLNAYNADIAHIRIKKWTERVVTLPREYVNGVTIDGLVIPATGDLFTGEIHAELKESNERRLLESLLELGCAPAEAV